MPESTSMKSIVCAKEIPIYKSGRASSSITTQVTRAMAETGWSKPVNELYPGDRIVELAIEQGIPFTTASDAHSHAQLGDKFPRLAQEMANFGIRQVCIFERHNRIQASL